LIGWEAEDDVSSFEPGWSFYRTGSGFVKYTRNATGKLERKAIREYVRVKCRRSKSMDGKFKALRWEVREDKLHGRR